MLIIFVRGKGGRSRHALLSPDLLALLRAWWHEGRRDGVMRPGGWLFPGQDPANPITTRQLRRDERGSSISAAGVRRAKRRLERAEMDSVVCWQVCQTA